MTEKSVNFEKAFKRLEEILESMNSGSFGLDDSLKLYEEADSLILACNKQLSSAEKKIEVLIKNRKKELSLDESGTPIAESFTSLKNLEGSPRNEGI